MFKELADFGKQLFTLTRDAQQNKADIKELREDLKLLRQEFGELVRVVERLAREMQHERESAQRERQLQQLSLENILLRHERGLPPTEPKEKPREITED